MIALLGQSVLDRTFWPDGAIEERLGGPPRFAAAALADRAPALVITRGGSTELREPLHAFGLEVVEATCSLTTVFEVTLHGDGTWSESIAALGEPFTGADFDHWIGPAAARCSTVVCGSLWQNDITSETLRALAGGGRRVFLDGQGAARPQRLGPIKLEGPLDPQSLRSVAVLKLSQGEAETLIGGINARGARDSGVPVVVVTLGERGAVVLIDGVATEIRVEPVLGLADTVGAGDSFLALMAAAIEDGSDPLQATANACDAVAALLRQRLAAERAPQPVAPASAA